VEACACPMIAKPFDLRQVLATVDGVLRPRARSA
jgi:DNA-binding response OmpR family regulator